MIAARPTAIAPGDLFSRFSPRRRLSRLFHFPLARVFVIALFLVPVFALNAILVFQVIEQVGEPLATHIDTVRTLFMIPLLLLSYSLYCRYFENRRALEISLPGGGREWAAGFLAATTLVVLFVALISVFGSFEIQEYRPAGILLTNFLAFSAGSLLQDLILVCVVFRLVEEYAGTWIALLVSLVIFALAHAGNPNQTLVTTAFLAFSSLVLVAPFILTRRLWLGWGFHAGWNFMQAGVFGMANSGIQVPGWMMTAAEGPGWLTGGAVGLEAAYPALIIDTAIGIVLLLLAIRAGKLVEPSWRSTGAGHA
jgi:membrane protease YdiL (CAAX protease family)